MSLKDPIANKAYKHQWYLENAEVIKKRVKAQKKQRSIKSEQALRELKNRPCLDCGGSFPSECMDFDHIPGRGAKHFNISSAIYTRKWSTILEEVRKCELICSNCHRIRTKKRKHG
jgi:hypothetical protein